MSRPRTVRRSTGRIAAAAIALALLGLADAPRDPGAIPDALRPAAGLFLIASDQIRGSIFRESVVFLVSHGESGALGLIVNRPTGVSLHDAVKGAPDGAGDLYLGGPVERSQVMVLVRSEAAPENALHVAADVFMTVDPAILVEQAAKLGADGRLRAYAGYAGWGPGQLEREIARGDWIVADEPTGSIFDSEPGNLWKKLFRKHHRLMTSAPDPGGPAI